MRPAKPLSLDRYTSLVEFYRLVRDRMQVEQERLLRAEGWKRVPYVTIIGRRKTFRWRHPKHTQEDAWSFGYAWAHFERARQRRLSGSHACMGCAADLFNLFSPHQKGCSRA